MEAIKYKLVYIANDLKELYDEYGVLSADNLEVHISETGWANFAEGEKVKVKLRDYESDFPIITYFIKDGIKFYCIWDLERYMKGDEINV